MDLERMKNAQTTYLGKNIIYLPKLESTQTYAKQLEKSKAPNGTIVITDNQTQGIGTQDRKWICTKEKNITMTLILYPNTHISNLENLTLLLAQAIQKSIYELYEYELTIKEPNDLLLNGKKIGGILTQSKTLKEEVTNLYIGIGFNVNEESFAPEISRIATSLKKEYQRDFQREEIICKVLEEIENIIKNKT